MPEQELQQPLAELQVADSRFLGFCASINSVDNAKRLQQSLQSLYPDAAHVPLIWKMGESGYDEDGEPPKSVGPGILTEMRSHENVAVVVVRYFGSQLLGVTCGRLPQCYQAIAKLTLHRYFQGHGEPMKFEIEKPGHNVYGMAAGDCELILNVVKDNKDSLVKQLQKELDFDGFRGAKGEVLPRLQNLQADMKVDSIPIYRYPGNYSGTEWETFCWSPTSLKIKQSVEACLEPLVHQTMNHCVTNYYRTGDDFIAHHSDKDLDLNREGVIVSVSLGDERMMELRRRTEPKDVTRIVLPHCSMLVLGPKTNAAFSHSILPRETKDDASKNQIRISLTLRDVKTSLDTRTGRLFGQGVRASRSDIRNQELVGNAVWFGGFCSLSAWLISSRRPVGQCAAAGLFAVGSFSVRYLSKRWHQRKEEASAREFFSKKSMSGTKY